MRELLTSSYFYMFYSAIMIGVFCWCVWTVLLPYFQARRISKQVERQIKELLPLDDLNSRFQHFDEWLKNQPNGRYLQQYMVPAWDQYYHKFIQQQQMGVAFTPDVYDYFYEEAFVQKFGHRKFSEIVPGIFLAMGIIGTFLGIAIGVSALDPNGDSSALKSGIGILLSGMQVKFISSILGIVLSLVWQLMDKRKFYPILVESFYRIRKAMDEAFPTQEESIVLYQMLKNQEKQMVDFQSFLSELFIPKMVSGFSEALDQTLMPHLEQTQSIMNDMVKSANTNQIQGINQMVDHFVTSLSQITGDHMRDLGDALKTTIEWQKRVHEEMGTLVESMQNSAREQSLMVEKTTVLTDQIHQYTAQITDYQEVLEKTVSQLNQTTDKNTQLHTATSDLLERMVEERRVFHDFFDEHVQKLQYNVESFVNQTNLQLLLQQKLEGNLERIQGVTQSQETLAVTLSVHADLSQKSNQQLTELVQSFAENATLFVELQEGLHNIVGQMNEERERIDTVLGDMHQNFAGQLDQMDDRVETIRQVWESTSDVMTKMNKQLSVSMNQFTDDMHRGLEHTFQQFDQELSKSVQYLSNGVQAIQEGIVDLPDALQVLKLSVTELNKHAKRMVNPA